MVQHVGASVKTEDASDVDDADSDTDAEAEDEGGTNTSSLHHLFGAFGVQDTGVCEIWQAG